MLKHIRKIPTGVAQRCFSLWRVKTLICQEKYWHFSSNNFSGWKSRHKQMTTYLKSPKKWRRQKSLKTSQTSKEPRVGALLPGEDLQHCIPSPCLASSDKASKRPGAPPCQAGTLRPPVALGTAGAQLPSRKSVRGLSVSILKKGTSKSVNKCIQR